MIEVKRARGGRYGSSSRLGGWRGDHMYNWSLTTTPRIITPRQVI
jgi:hypothetical protein